MMISNSSTIILISKITLLPKFLDAIESIAITNVVYEEIIKKDSFENLTIKKEIERGRIKVELIEEREYLNILKQFKLDEGEASTFALFANKRYKAILTDDKELIKLCKISGVSFITAMAAAVSLYKKKTMSKEETLDKIEKLQGYGRYSNDVYIYFKNLVR